MPPADRLVDRIAQRDPVDDGVARRSVVPPAARRTLWLAAAWTGIGSALLAAIVSIVVVAVLWLPASSGSGGADSVIRGGLLTFLAALHAGVTVDGMSTAFVPLGLTILLGLVAWRAGCGLADAADDLDEDRPRPLLLAGAVQALGFALSCTVAAALATLGTSSVPVIGVFGAAFVLFAVTGGTAFVRWSALGEQLGARTPPGAVRVVRAAIAGVLAYVGVGALLVGAAVVVAHHRVEALSAQVGGGWSGVPILLLGVLAAPNAAVAGAAYLAGPGFAVGSGNHVSVLTTAHGTLPAFPVLGALPSGHGATWPVWALVGVLPVVGGACVARAVRAAAGWGARFRDAACAALLAVPIGLVLAWQAGGAIGSGRLHAIGASPWQFGLALGVALAVAGSAVLGVAALVTQLRGRESVAPPSAVLRSTRAVLAAGAAAYRATMQPDTADPHEDDEDDKREDDEADEDDAGGRGGSKLAG